MLRIVGLEIHRPTGQQAPIHRTIATRMELELRCLRRSAIRTIPLAYQSRAMSIVRPDEVMDPHTLTVLLES